MDLIEGTGYMAMLVSLLSINMKNVLWFRLLHLASCIIYMIYGILLDAMPIIIGMTIFTLMHIYHIYKLKRNGLQK